MRIVSSALFLLATALLVLGCPKESEPVVTQTIPPAGLAGTQPGDASHAKMGALEQEQLATNQMNRPVITGKIVEAIYKDAYSYIRLELQDNKSAWVAIVNNKPKVGETISVQEQAVFKDFHSKSLDRTFDQITFGPIVN